MQPYLESLLNYIDGAPPWTPANKGHGIMSRPLRHHHEVSPRGSWNYVMTTYQSHSTNKVILIVHINLMPTIYNQSSFIFHVESMPTHPSQTMNIELYFVPTPCHFNNQPSHTCHMPRSC